MAAKGVSSRAAQAEQTRRQILDTARRLFGEVGYEATSTQMIANELRLTKAAVHYHFHAKADIMIALMEPGKQRLAGMLDEVEALRTQRARIDRFASGLADYLTGYRFVVTAARILADSALGGKDEMEPLHRRALTALFGERPTSTQHLSYRAATGLAIGLEDLNDLSDEDLRAALYATIARILRVPSRPARALSPARLTDALSTPEADQGPGDERDANSEPAA
ncbi:MAG: TetR/AcrR family transcriptional regulator [Trebonia sp.]